MREGATLFLTENGGKYLLQLCKHFAHKIAVEQVDDCAELRFSCGTGYLKSAPDGLHIRVVSADDADLAKTKHVIEGHLLRFAFRENAGPLHWTDF
ncbi:DUF2218 domain-containing protein [Sinorhizobium medicae]|uniref:DUF2218 domain-containing protein n=1 Tax=Sinorhizobium medicae TaxID=110321 RepID=UPI0003681FD4|nr:DUF2218 domain-containing protein [Sinorhizobium medicae]MDX0444901.1 DUF2218 domain-containing protein [Sinorhizobium medicae]MDX0541849.1 DUF2218 domain-containing protein [Sinorhizobium medicae]MDX0876251.1 DUF2218 domain-containing protein [Sinorhizobium medicae]MDX0955193.1 DUF2218 domain-containing protein [Sinorhizobium medicae]MDX0997922.1 DUF2218 domain-containing protein [Sinorhizobium medicae]